MLVSYSVSVAIRVNEALVLVRDSDPLVLVIVRDAVSVGFVLMRDSC